MLQFGPPLAHATAETSAMLHGMSRRVAILGLDLDGLAVVTEAATGAYACTAVIAAMAGARRVTALARETARHGSAADAAAATLGLARLAGVADRIEVICRLQPAQLADCDILTNSGHLRPIGLSMIDALPDRAVIALMFEGWEFRGADLDLAAARARRIPVAAVNERHRDVGVFPFLGPLAVRLLDDAGLGAAGRRVAVVCDNPFAAFIEDGLRAAGAEVAMCAALADLPSGRWDAVLLALNPAANPALGAHDAADLARRAPGALLAQFWGDVDRAAARAAGLAIAPEREPGRGHMGILLNALGPEAIIRLQAGGLRAAEIIRRGGPASPEGIAHLI